MSDIQREQDENFKAFQRMVPKLKTLRGKYFLMRHGKIINYYNTLDDAHSTGDAVYDDKIFSVCLLGGAKRTAKKEPVKKGASKKKGASNKKLAMTSAALTTNKKALPRKTDVRGYNPNFPDQGPWEIAAHDLHVFPFYKGSDQWPFRCLEATLQPTSVYRKEKLVSGLFNDFRINPDCRRERYG